MTDAGDVRVQLNDLEAEEARIMRELREMDEKAHAETEANKRRAEQYKEDPDSALTSLLLECEKEVRDAKGYIADQGPPLRIVRLRHGETGPKSATYLSRPRNTGVDFTVPVTLKAYTDIIKQPIFLNQIRDKIKQQKYSSTEDYLEDMRLLVRNTAQFNTGPDLAWVVQHARFLQEAAQDAVTSRRLVFRDVEEALRQRATQKQSRQSAPALAAVGKRKRSQPQEKTNGDISAIPAVGSAIEIYWGTYRKWYLAYIIAHGDGGTCHLRYDEDNSLQWVTLDHERWRMRNSRFTGAARGRRAHEQPAKRRKSGSAASPTTDSPVIVPTGITAEDLDAIKIDLFAKFDDLRDSIMEQLKEHLQRIDRAVIRSDALSRILVQVEDTQAHVEKAMTGVGKKFDTLEKRVQAMLEPKQQRDVEKVPESNERPDVELGTTTEEGNIEKEPLNPNDMNRQRDSRLENDGAEQEEGSLGIEGEKKDIRMTEEDEASNSERGKGETEGSLIGTVPKVSVDLTPVNKESPDLNTSPGKKLVSADSPNLQAESEKHVASTAPDFSPKDNVEMADVGAAVENNNADASDASDVEDLSGEGLGKPPVEANIDVKPDSLKETPKPQQHAIDVDTGSKGGGADVENGGSSDSEQSDSSDSASDENDANRRTAEKKPATKSPLDKEFESQPDKTESKREEKTDSKQSSELAPGTVSPGKTSDVAKDETAEKDTVPEGETVADGDKKAMKSAAEKPSDEIETVAISGATSETPEHGNDYSSGSREVKVTGDAEVD